MGMGMGTGMRVLAGTTPERDGRAATGRCRGEDGALALALEAAPLALATTTCFAPSASQS